MAIRKRKWKSPDGTIKSAWVVDYTDQAGERHIKTFQRKKDAEEYAPTVAVEVRAGIHTADSASITVAKAAADWLRAGREADLEGSTMDQREQHVRLHIAPFIGGLKLSQMSVPRVRAFESELRAAGRSDVMVRKVITSLSGILSDAQERGTVARNVVRELKGKRRVATDRHKRRIEAGVDIPLPSEVKAIIAALAELDSHYRPVILTALFTGLRASELRGLDWRHVDLEAEVIHVRQRADKRNQIGSPKTASSQRTVPLTPLVVNALKAPAPADRWQGPGVRHAVRPAGQYPEHREAGLVAGADRRGPEQARGRQQGQADGRRQVSGLHAARHFYASWCINAPEAGGLGLSAKAVQVRLGHSTITMTLDVYGHLFPSGDDGAKLAAAEAALLAQPCPGQRPTAEAYAMNLPRIATR